MQKMQKNMWISILSLWALAAGATETGNVRSRAADATVIEPGLYCVIDLSGGANATSYPVSYVTNRAGDEINFNSDEYKTTKLALRRIDPGTSQAGGAAYYIGVFEITQKQYELVRGSNPSHDIGSMRPVETVSWNEFYSGNNSFLGCLKARTGLNFDLPTEAQWEYACRAGTTSAYNNGGNSENDLKNLGRYLKNHSDGRGGYSSSYTAMHTTVGSYQPNQWGLYDMHGNVCEWCLEWYGTASQGMRVARGGSCIFEASDCTSTARVGTNVSGGTLYQGFRIVLTLSKQVIIFPEIEMQFATNEVVLNASASSGLPVAYEVSSGPGVLTGDVLTFTGPGTVTVAASQAGNESWSSAETGTQSIEVEAVPTVVTLGNLQQTFNGEAREATVATDPEGVAVTVTYDGEEEAPVHAGSYTVVAETADARYSGSATGTLVVAKAPQDIDFPDMANGPWMNRVPLEATADSGLAVAYEVVSGPGTVADGILSFTGPGAVTVRASQDGDSDWLAAEPVEQTVTAGKGTAAVTLGDLAQVYDGEEKQVTVVTQPGGLVVAVTYGGAETLPVNAGRYAVEAVVDDANWAGSAMGTLVVAKGSQTIDFADIGPQVATNTVALSATASTGLDVKFAVLSGPGTVEGNVLSFTGAGTVMVMALQEGTANWAQATVLRTIEVAKAVAAVTLSGLEQTYDGEAKVVGVATVPEGLAVAFTYDGSDAAPVDAGSYAVVAMVTDDKWEGNASGTLVVAKGTQTIDFPAIGEQILTNQVILEATASSGLPVAFAVADGPGTVESGVLSFTGVGTVLVVASQDGNENWNAAEPVTNAVEVSGMLTLTVACPHGTATPTAGTHDILIGTAVEATASGSPAAIAEGLQAVCTGWRLSMGGVEETGEGTETGFTMTDSATLTWLWETQALIEVEGLAHGTAEGGGWFTLGERATLTATPEAGHPFTGWEGVVPGGVASANPCSFTVARPGVAIATFFTTYYASETGDDSASGLSWTAAKREISAALAETAEGDTVLAGPGIYGPIDVPADVAVRSTDGPEETTIPGGTGTRCVEAAEGATVEGFTLEGAEVEGDGAGALLADDAALFRCILRGNKAGGSGGGAKGGALENCMIVGNEAADGGGAANAELRHCTVVQNRGGGAVGCRTVNSVFWENEGGDVSGGTTTYSLCNPWVEGAGNLDGDPLFAGEGDWRLAYESPCINAAADSGVEIDLAGAPRPQPKVFGEVARPDMGCWEYVPKARFVWSQGKAIPPYESLPDAARDIQSALDISGSGDRIVVEAGTYGAVTVSNAVILMGNHGAEETVIDAGNAGRAVTMSAGGTLTGFTIRNGAEEDCGGIFADGGAVVRDVIVENCRATGAEGIGGGLCLQGGSTAENVVARGNAAAYGGGIHAAETSAVVRCELTGNTASVRGGGAYLEGGSRMEESRVADNTAVRGAGVYGEDCEIAWSEMEGNEATGAGGGAAIVGGTFRNNRLAGNRAGTGGGLFAQDTDGHDCLVAGNEAGRGAGAWAEGAGAFWNFTVAANTGSGAGVVLRGTMLFGNGIAWDNAGGNLDAADGTEVRYSCAEPVPEGEGNFADDPAFVGGGDYHLRAGSPCVDTGERLDWMSGVEDFDGQPRVHSGDGNDGRDVWVDVGTDEAALDAVGFPTCTGEDWTWRVVLDARLQLQRTTGLLPPAPWENVNELFTATDQTWKQEESFEGDALQFYRLLWIKD